jgi:glycopeptide antibiotics resistance protein
MSIVFASISLVVAGVALGVAVATRRGGGNREWRAKTQSLAVDVALISSVAAILAITWIPMGGPDEVELLPFADIAEALMPPVDTSLLLGAAYNILLFLPFGAALRLRGFRLAKTVLSGLALSAAVEASQLLFISGRTTSIDDLVLNAMGAVLGYVLLSPWPLPVRK